MGIFSKDGKTKSAVLLSAFSVSLIVVFAYFAFYMLSAGAVAFFWPDETGGFIAKWLPPSLVSIVASIPWAILLFVMRDKRVIPAAFVFLLVYTALIALFVTNTYSGEERSALLNLVFIYLGLPAFWGGLISFGLYSAFFRNRTPR
ncbi:MAG: hypothetical protein LBK40_04370 [Spirochaetaceae bacterium]|jgi:hypothetical protein|nr:hypothetical protein [Spirochaetaceae bacterium]